MMYRFNGLELLDQNDNIVVCVGMPVEKMPEEIRGMARVDVTFLDFHGKLIIGTKNAFVQSLRLLIYKKTYVLEALAKATVQDCDAVFEDAFYSVRTALDTWFKDAIKPIAGDRESVYKIGNKKICAGIYPDCIYINVAYSKVVIILEPRCEFRGEFDRYNGIVGQQTNVALIGLDNITVVDGNKNVTKTLLSLFGDLSDAYKKKLVSAGVDEAVKVIKGCVKEYYFDFVTVGFPVDNSYQKQLILNIIEHFCRHEAEVNRADFLCEDSLFNFLKKYNTIPEMNCQENSELPYIEESVDKITKSIPGLKSNPENLEKHSFKWLFDAIDVGKIIIEWDISPDNYIGRYYMRMIIKGLTDILKSMEVEYKIEDSIDHELNCKWINMSDGEFKIPTIPVGRKIVSCEQYIELARTFLPPRMFDVVYDEKTKYLSFSQDILSDDFRGIESVRFSPELRCWDVFVSADNHPLCKNDKNAIYKPIVEEYRALVLEDWFNNTFDKRKNFPWGYISLEHEDNPYCEYAHISQIRIHYPTISKELEVKLVNIENSSGKTMLTFESPDGEIHTIQSGYNNAPMYRIKELELFGDHIYEECECQAVWEKICEQKEILKKLNEHKGNHADFIYKKDIYGQVGYFIDDDSIHATDGSGRNYCDAFSSVLKSALNNWLGEHDEIDGKGGRAYTRWIKQDYFAEILDAVDKGGICSYSSYIEKNVTN
ncbi:MAG: hypothetical protein K6F84_08410 [Lachnospiraceae bacterium]|nr:hypothetical protein [Lachnospiraceae bacterium]